MNRGKNSEMNNENLEEHVSMNVNDEYDIYAFLEDHRVERGKTFTHLSMGFGKMQGCFFVRNSEIDMFYDLYEKAIFNDKEIYLVEKNQ